MYRMLIAQEIAIDDHTGCTLTVPHRTGREIRLTHGTPRTRGRFCNRLHTDERERRFLSLDIWLRATRRIETCTGQRGRVPVPQYKLLREDENGGLTTVKSLEAPNDYEAIIKAKQMNLGGELELWEGPRAVATVRPWRSV